MTDEDITSAHPPSPPSDLTFVSRKYAREVSRTFKLHKDTVCLQSAWFRQSVAEKASTDRVIDNSGLSDDILARMLAYLYDGNYSLTYRYPCTPPFNDGSENEAGSEPSDMSEEEAIRAGKTTLTNVLLMHVRVRLAAAHFGIPALELLSEAKLAAALALCPEFKLTDSLDLVEVVEEIYQAYEVEYSSLKQHLIDALVRDLKELPNDVRATTFSIQDDDLSRGFACDIVDELVDLLSEAGDSIRMLTARLRDARSSDGSSSVRGAGDRVEGGETMRGEND